MEIIASVLGMALYTLLAPQAPSIDPAKFEIGAEPANNHVAGRKLNVSAEPEEQIREAA